jgi:putative salt-induced outer membrane protein YdiY
MQIQFKELNMLKNFIKLIISAIIAASALAYADQQVSNWHGTLASLGFTENGGNTTDTSLNSSVLIQYTYKHLANAFKTTAGFSSNKDGVTKEQYYVENEFDYNFLDAHKQFLFFDTNSTFDRFSAYKYAWVSSAGYGLLPLLTEHWSLTMRAGPGLRMLQDRKTKVTSEYPILNTAANLAYTLDKDGKSKLSEAVLYNVGKPYNYFSTTTALSMQIMKHLSAILSYQRQWTSKIPAGSDHTDLTDTLTTMNLVFSY